MRRALLQLTALLLASEVAVQLLVGDARLAQLLAPGGSWWAIVLVALALALRLLVVLGLPVCLVVAALEGAAGRAPLRRGDPGRIASRRSGSSAG